MVSWRYQTPKSIAAQALTVCADSCSNAATSAAISASLVCHATEARTTALIAQYDIGEVSEEQAAAEAFG